MNFLGDELIFDYKLEKKNRVQNNTNHRKLPFALAFKMLSLL